MKGNYVLSTYFLIFKKIISVYFHFFQLKKNCTPCCGKIYSLNKNKNKNKKTKEEEEEEEEEEVKLLTEPKNCNMAPLNIKVNLVWVLTQLKKKNLLI